MTTKKGRNHGQPFTCLVGNFPYGSFPDQNIPVFQAPPPSRQAFTHQVLTVGDERVSAQNHVGLMDGAIAPKVGTLTVADDDFTTGVAVLYLGDFTLTSDVDYVTGAGAATTAANLAAAITPLFGFVASAVGADVTINYTAGPADIVPFRVVYYGTKTNFVPVTPNDGFLGNGGPHFDAIALI
jgi:hypothetical protein